MDAALKGFLIGLGVAIVLIFFEYYTAKKSAAERAAARHQKPELGAEERTRIRGVINFAIFLPPGFALGAWLIEKFVAG